MKKFVPFLAAAIISMGLTVPAHAEKYDDGSPITHTAGTSTTFDKYLVMKQDAEVPYADFLFEVTSDGAIGNPATDDANEEIYPQVLVPATNGDPKDVTPVVWKGVRPDKVVVTPTAGADETVGVNVGELTFLPTDATTNGVYRNGPVVKGDIATATEKYVKKQITLSFANIKFAEPGVYRYYLQEKNGKTYKDLGIVYDVNANNSTWRTVDVYVLDDGSGNLSVSDYVWYEGKISGAPSHTANITTAPAAKGNAWAVDWTDATDTTKVYKYVSNDIWQVWVNNVNSGETVTEPPSDATGNVAIDGQPYTTWGAAKARMKQFNDKKLTPNGAEASNKSSEFVNKYGTQDLEFGKKVEGNQGSRDQWFKFNLTLTHADLIADSKFEVVVGSTVAGNVDDFFTPTKNSATSYAVTDMTNANTSSTTGTYKDYKFADFTFAKNGTGDKNYLKVLNPGTDGRIEWELYLQSGHYVVVKGIPNGVSYTVTETDPATGYTKINGTDLGTEILGGKEISNAHKDALTGVIGAKTATYIADAQGIYCKDASGNFFDTTAMPAPACATTTPRYSPDLNVYTGVTNKRSGVIPTGVAMGIAGALVLLVVAGGYFIMRRRSVYDY